MPVVLRAVRPNAGIRAMFRRRLEKELEEMRASISYWVLTAYRARESEIARDASPARDILDRFDKEARRWLRRWDWLAAWLGRRFVRRVGKTSASALRAAFRDAGFTVKFDNNRIVNAVTQSLIAENVNLIKSIPWDYLGKVREIITRGASMGNDVPYIAKELEKRYGLTKKRAKRIAWDQTNKANEAINNAWAKKFNIQEADWVHIPGVKTSRPTHKAMDGKRFMLSEGLYDSEKGVRRKVKPGELPNCQCTCRYVIPEFGA